MFFGQIVDTIEATRQVSNHEGLQIQIMKANVDMAGIKFLAFQPIGLEDSRDMGRAGS